VQVAPTRTRRPPGSDRLDHSETQRRARTAFPNTDLLQGTLDVLILKTLVPGAMHGWGIAQRIQQVSQDVLRVNQGSLYPALHRLEEEGWIAAEWGASENNRKAKFYSITKSGLKQLAKETDDWERISAVIGRVLRLEGQSQ
jgi:transcriptional regulator